MDDLPLTSKRAVVSEHFLRDGDPRSVSWTLRGCERLTIARPDGSYVDVLRGTPEWDRIVPLAPSEGAL